MPFARRWARWAVFVEVPAPTLGAIAVEEAVRRAGIDADQVDEVLMGNVLQAGLGQNPARQAALGAKLSTEDRVNVNGGAIALGHPIDASGTRILTTLLYEMARRDVELGLAGMCIGGGQGIAMVIERV